MSAADPYQESGWVSRQVAVLAEAWERGQELSAGTLIAGQPEVTTDDAIRLIYEEVCLRREAGQEVATEEVVARYPRWREPLQALLECDRLLRPAEGPRDFPAIGETLGPFTIHAELGRGAAGRTYRASDPTLADREVVIKAIPDHQQEHLALAQLRHTHIVPLFSEHRVPERGLRLLCMPYLGGVSLAQVLHELAGTPVPQRTGRMLVEAIDRRSGPSPDPVGLEGPDRRSLQAASYEQAVVWITICLAEALHYAHARGLVHMDVKPSNVLLTADGQPILLDFHLAHRPIAAGEWVLDPLGGTPGWMAPEQQRALQAVVEAEPTPLAVDGRSDLFALGLLLAEALGLPRDSHGPRPGWISVGLADIVRRCLAPQPADRYATAARLAEDLRRHLDDRPLVGVRNRSLPERWRKWRRRHPAAPAWLVAGAVLIAASGFGLSTALRTHQEQLGRVESLLREGHDLRLAGQFDRSAEAIEEGLKRARGLTGAADLVARLGRERTATDRARLAHDLHALADLIRFRHGLDLPRRAESETLLRSCQAIWNARGRLLPDEPASRLDPTETAIRADLIELAAIQVDLQTRRASPETAESARQAAVQILDQAQADLGPSFALSTRRATLDPTAPDPPGQPRTAWEHLDLGRYLLRSGQIEAAEMQFLQTLRLEPANFWAHYLQGLCAYRLGRPAEALSAFRVCTALAPDHAVCFHNRGLAYEALHQPEAARDDYTRALELDPNLTAARLNRGIVAYRAGQHAAAIADFERALSTDPTGPLQGRVHYNLALAQRARGDLAAARRSAERAVQLGVPEAAALAPR